MQSMSPIESACQRSDGKMKSDSRTLCFAGFMMVYQIAGRPANDKVAQMGYRIYAKIDAKKMLVDFL